MFIGLCVCLSLLFTGVCTAASPLIVGGTEAEPGAFPYQVDPNDVEAGPNYFYSQFCGGFLIDK